MPGKMYKRAATLGRNASPYKAGKAKLAKAARASPAARLAKSDNRVTRAVCTTFSAVLSAAIFGSNTAATAFESNHNNCARETANVYRPSAADPAKYPT